jgi:hypothetical protein|tara:strand:+ start:935 stop:1132 length:198 start_codon:yes stop_codon:yes gene_type:complete
MKTVKLTHQHSSRDVIINWNNVLFCAATESNLGESYTEVAFEHENALPVKETVEEIAALLNENSE